MSGAARVEDPAGRERERADAPDARSFVATVVPHTHWDREWYEPFEVFRARLLDVVDRVLELLERGEGYDRFMLDGQAVVLEDYLAIRPERAADIRRLVEAGKLVIGPWYVLADEFLVSPEALIRNLARGRRVCRRLGGIMRDAYTPDSFGHISQLPLLAAGFGLEAVVFERGVGDEGPRLGGEFCWVAADGVTRRLAVHLLGTYSSAAGLGHADWELGDPFDLDRAVNQIRAAIFGTEDTDPSDLALWLRTSFASVPGGMAAFATSPSLLLLNGSDHLFPQENLPAILEAAQPRIPEVELRIGLLDDYLDGVRKPLETFAAFQGEFRSSRYHHCLYGVLSARLPLKQANHRAQTLLERYAEPAAALAWLAGNEHPTGLLDEAWRLLLLNHPHDSICGCSVDPVHEEMRTRFAKVGQLGTDVVRRSLAALAKDAGEIGVMVFNPLPSRRAEVVTFEHDAPEGTGARLRVLDQAGRTVTSQAVVTRAFAPGSSTRFIDKVRVSLLAEVPGLGLSAYRLATADDRGAVDANVVASVVAPGAGSANPSTDTPHAHSATTSADATHVSEGVRASPTRMENERLAVTYDADGLWLAAKDGSPPLPLKLRFEDVADRGDSYDFGALPGDSVIVADAPLAAPEVTEAGPVSATWRLRYQLDLPARLAADRQAREGNVLHVVKVELRLAAGRSWLELDVELDNRAEDHRLRLVVPTQRRTDAVFADGHFDVLRRGVGTPAGEAWRQPPVPTSHQRRFVLAADASGGLAVLNRGLPEYEASHGASGVELHLTLLRCVGWLSRDDIPERRLESAGPERPTPGAQNLGRQRFELALYPFRGSWWESGVLDAARAFDAPLLAQVAARVASTEGGLELLGATDDASTPLELSCFKRADAGDGLIVRVWNPAPVPATGRFRFAADVSDAGTRTGTGGRDARAGDASDPRAELEVHETDLAEERLARRDVRIVAGRAELPLSLGPKEVRTYLVVKAGRRDG